jgi:putative transcriptional regulator
MIDLTQEALANELGIARQTMIAIEKGKYNPSLELAFRLAKFFDTTIEELFIHQESPRILESAPRLLDESKF